MTQHVPPLETERLIVRAFSMQDLHAIHHILDVELADGDADGEGTHTFDERERWLRWTVLSYEQLAQLHQPPYGDRAVVLRESGRLVGACGYVPTLAPFEQLPRLAHTSKASAAALMTPEVGLYYAVSPRYQGRGYATEVATTLVEYGFEHLRLKRIVAMTTHDNAASRRVMEKLGMQIERNPLPEPPWLQLVGVLANPDDET